MTAALAPLPVLLPLLGAGAALIVGRHARLQRAVSATVLTAVLLVACILLVQVDRSGVVAVTLGGWAPPLGITIVVDRLSALMLVVSATVTLLVLVYAVGQGAADGDHDGVGTPLSIFHPTYLVLVAGVSMAFLAGDLFNLYVGFEVLLAASYVLLTLGGTRPRVQAGITYAMVGLLSSLVFLAGIGMVYAATGTLNMAQLAGRLDALPEGTRTALHLVLLIAFGIKAAVFPLSSWLPDSYPTALAPITAVFAGLLTKVGVYAIIRTQTLLFPSGSADAAGGRSSPISVTTVLLVVALATMVIGALGAVAQSDIKRMLSFTLVSHIGYMVFGVAMGTRAGLAGAVFYVVHHILVQTTLFLAAGLVERIGGSTSLRRLGGLARKAPLVAVIFFVAGMNLGGVPPMSGFIGKLGLIRAGAEQGGALVWLVVAGAVLTSLLTLYAVARVWSQAFWRPAPAEVTTPAASPTPEVSNDPGSRRGTGGDVVTGPNGTSSAVGSGTVTVVAEPDDGEPDGSAPDGSALDRSAPVPRAMMIATCLMLAVVTGLTLVAGPLYAVGDRAVQDLMSRTPYVHAVYGEGQP